MTLCQKCIHRVVCVTRRSNTPLEEKNMKFCTEYKPKSRFVELPCEVGQTVYYLDKYSNSVETDTAVFFTVTKDGCKAILKRHNKRFWEDQEWGKTVFLSRELAEKALSERNLKK